MKNRIKELREEYGYSQEELARLIDFKVQSRTIGYVENDVKPISLDVANLIANVFNVSLDYLLRRTDARTNNLEVNKYLISVSGDLDKNGVVPEQLRMAIELIKNIKLSL